MVSDFTKPGITAFFDEWERKCRKHGSIALAMRYCMEPYGGFGNLTIGEENAAYEDMRKQCERRGLEVLECGPYLVTKVKA